MDKVIAHIDQNQKRYQDELFTLLRIPSISADPSNKDDCRKAAEWTKKKFDEGKYKSSEIYGRPSDPALIKEYEDYLKQKLGSKAYDEYVKRQQQMRQQTPARPQRKQ